MLAPLELQDYDQRFLRALEAADILALQRLVVLTTNSVGAETTNAEALRLMLQDGIDAMVKTEAGKPKGIVRRDEIVSRLMLTLASS